MTSVPTLSVVVVTYSPGEMLPAFLDSLPAALKGTCDIRLCGVVLADNGSVDGSPETEVADRTEVTLLPTGGNLGYGTAANLGLAACVGVFVLIANPDVVLAPGSLDTLVEAFDRWPRAGAVGPLIYTPTGDIYPSARSLPSLGRGIGHALAGWWWPDNPWTRAYRRESGTPTEGPVGWLSGSCLLVRREAFESVGGFDTSYFMYFEDTDLGARLARAGWLNVYVPTATVAHYGGHSTARDSTRMVEEHHRSAYRYLSRQYHGVRWLPVRIVLRAGLWGRATVARLLPAVAAGARPSHRRSVDANASAKKESE